MLLDWFSAGEQIFESKNCRLQSYVGYFMSYFKYRECEHVLMPLIMIYNLGVTLRHRAMLYVKM